MAGLIFFSWKKPLAGCSREGRGAPQEEEVG